jgi:hypothetical protein
MSLWLISDRSNHDLLGVHFPTMCVLQSIHLYTVHYIIIFQVIPSIISIINTKKNHTHTGYSV